MLFLVFGQEELAPVGILGVKGDLPETSIRISPVCRMPFSAKTLLAFAMSETLIITENTPSPRFSMNRSTIEPFLCPSTSSIPIGLIASLAPLSGTAKAGST